MNEFRREDRYVVLKRSDLQKHAAVADLYALDRILEIVALGRASEGKPAVQQYVVVASDWPEYEVVWDLIRRRVEGGQPPAPSYAALEIIATSVCGALGRAGLTDVDDPGEAIDVMRERYEARISELTEQQAAEELSTLRLDCTKPVSRVIADIVAELRRAGAKFPSWPTDPIHAATVVGEEAGEILKGTLQAIYEPHKSTMEDARAEAIQTAAMAIRFALGMPHYVATPCEQVEQELL